MLHDPHAHFHQQRHDHHQRRDDEAVDHGPDACLLHAGEGGVQADGGQGADHQELAGGLGAADYLRGEGEDARHDGHGQEAQDEPGEDFLDRELSLELAAVLLEGESFLNVNMAPETLFSQFYETMNNQPMTEEQAAYMLEKIEKIWGINDETC